MTTGTATYPFQRANAVGYLKGETLPSADANVIDNNAASGADGSLWTDLAIAMNWQNGETVAGGAGSSPLWMPISGGDGLWISFGKDSGNPTFMYAYSSGAWNGPGTMDVGDDLDFYADNGSATNGSVTIVGGIPGSASTSKIRVADNSLTPYFAEANTVASGAEGVRCAVWHEGASKFLVGMTNAATSNIEYSSDGETWAQATCPNTEDRRCMASNGTTVVCVSIQSSNKCITSTDGISWTERTLPNTQQWASVLWDSVSERFYAFGSSYWAYSSDGETWTQGSGSGAYFHGPNAIMGRVIVSMIPGSGAVKCGYIDDGGTIHSGYVAGFTGTAVATGCSGAQFLTIDSNGVHTRSFRGGLLD